MVEIDCPLCEIKKFKKLYYKDGMNVVECRNCGLIFTNPQLSQKELTSHYDKSLFCSHDPKDNTRYFDYNARYLEGKEKMRFWGIFEKLDRYYPKKGRLIDVGSATGFFIDEANKRGWQAEGVEISKWAANWGRKNLKVKIFTGDLRGANFKKQSFDVVAMLDFLEHVKNPFDELKEAARVIKEEGIIYVETINFDNWITRYLIGQKHRYMFPKWHLYFFGRRQLIKLLEKADFEILEYSLCSSSVGDYEYYGWKMYWQYLKLLINPPKGHNNYAFNDMIKIYARKK